MFLLIFISFVPEEVAQSSWSDTTPMLLNHDLPNKTGIITCQSAHKKAYPVFEIKKKLWIMIKAAAKDCEILRPRLWNILGLSKHGIRDCNRISSKI